MHRAKELRARPVGLVLGLLVVASALASTDSDAQIVLKPGIVVQAAFPAPALTFPAADIMVPLTNNAYVTAKVGWTYPAADLSKITHFEVCAWSAKSGAKTCSIPLGENHSAVNTSTLAHTITLYSQSGADWLYSIGACKGTIGHDPTCVWSAGKPIRVVPQLEQPKRVKPAAGASLTVPGSIEYQWSETPNTEFYLVCQQPATAATNAWACQQFEHVPSNSLDWSTTKSPAGKATIVKSYTTPNDILVGFGPDASTTRQWGVMACRHEYAPGTDGVSQVRCAHEPTLAAFTVKH